MNDSEVEDDALGAKSDTYRSILIVASLHIYICTYVCMYMLTHNIYYIYIYEFNVDIYYIYMYIILLVKCVGVFAETR